MSVKWFIFIKLTMHEKSGMHVDGSTDVSEITTTASGDQPTTTTPGGERTTTSAVAQDTTTTITTTGTHRTNCNSTPLYIK